MRRPTRGCQLGGSTRAAPEDSLVPARQAGCFSGHQVNQAFQHLPGAMDGRFRLLLSLSTCCTDILRRRRLESQIGSLGATGIHALRGSRMCQRLECLVERVGREQKRFRGGGEWAATPEFLDGGRDEQILCCGELTHRVDPPPPEFTTEVSTLRNYRKHVEEEHQ